MEKIVIIHHSARIGGGSICLTDIIEMLNEKYEVVTYCPEYPKDLKEYIQKLDFNVKTFNIPIPMFNQYSGGPEIYSRSFWKNLYSYKNIKAWESLLSKEKPDIVIVNSSVLALLGPTINKIGAKSICFTRETFNENKFSPTTPLMKYMLNNWFDGVLFISSYDKNYARLKKPLTEVVADSISPRSLEKYSRREACRDLKIESKTTNILFVGGGAPIKGLDTILKSFYYLNNDNVHLVICGYKPEITKPLTLSKKIIHFFIHFKKRRYINEVNKILNDEKMIKKIKLIGHQLDMSKAYSASDILVFPSSVPHQSRPAYEAGYFSIPIIISNFKQTREYIQNLKNGLTFKPRNSNDLRNKIEVLVNNQDLRRSLGNENYKFTKKLHNFEREKEKIFTFLQKI